MLSYFFGKGIVVEKVYVVIRDNGEDYDDWYREVKRVFRNKASAIAWILSEGYIEGPLRHWDDIPTYSWPNDKECIGEFLYIEEHILK